MTADTFTLEAGSVIEGDLYLAASNININPNSVINGSIFIVGSNISLKGQIGGSAYITAENFETNYYTYFSRDLYLNSKNATLAGVVHRNAFITATEKVETTPYFRVEQNLTVNSASEFIFSGEVKENAKINVQKLSFNQVENQKCIIFGNLECATKEDITVPDEIVVGEVTHSEYVETDKESTSVTDKMFDLFVLLVYVFGVVLLCKFFAPNAIKNISTLDFKSFLKSFAFGFLTLIAVVVLSILLILFGVGITFALVLIISYLFLLGISIPLFLNDIVKTEKWKLNLFLKLLIVTALFYLISLLPVIGSIFIFVVLLISSGRIVLKLFKK